MDGIERGAVEIPTPQPRLVADQRQPQPQLAKSTQPREGVGKQLDAGGVRQVVAIHDDGAVSVEDGEATPHEGSPIEVEKMSRVA